MGDYDYCVAFSDYLTYAISSSCCFSILYRSSSNILYILAFYWCKTSLGLGISKNLAVFYLTIILELTCDCDFWYSALAFWESFNGAFTIVDVDVSGTGYLRISD